MLEERHLTFHTITDQLDNPLTSGEYIAVVGKRYVTTLHYSQVHKAWNTRDHSSKEEAESTNMNDAVTAWCSLDQLKGLIDD